MFQRAVAFSLAGHLAVFGLFTLSFGSKFPVRGVTQGFFWGSILQTFEPTRASVPLVQEGLPIIARQQIQRLVKESSRDYPLTVTPYVKPLSIIYFVKEKITFSPKSGPWDPGYGKDAQPIMFYPRLPYHFLLYFQDRQSVHIELAYRIDPRTRAGSIEIRRKVSSGNLEADLLVMRYISHYLFIQEGGLAMSEWQTVRVDLSSKGETK